MSENPKPDPMGASQLDEPGPTTAGALLKAARQSAGVHLAVLSVNLKVPVRQLEAMEADLHPADQSPVFARGLAASMCRQLRVDPAPILALMPMTSNYLEPHGAVRQAYKAPADLGQLRRTSSGGSAKAWWAAVAMLVGIAVLIWLPSMPQWVDLERLRAMALPTPPAVQNLTTEVFMPPSVSAVAPSAESLAPKAAVGAMSVAPPPVVNALPELVFNAQNLSWIEVRDAQNQLIWNGVLNAGDAKRLSAELPVSVVIGRADAIQLNVKGQAFDFQPFTQVNTARFEVKP